jgi:hypothetical protein
MESLIVESDDWVEDFFRPMGPAPFEFICYTSPYVHYRHAHSDLLVIVSGRREKDGRRWVHVSMSYPAKLPGWNVVRMVKDRFIGRDKRAIQVLPPQSEYVNHHPNTLHLWHCVDGDGIPDFRIDGKI